MGKHSEYFIRRRENGSWVVESPHAERASAVTDTQAEAIERAQDFAPEGVIHVQGRDGKFRKI